MRVLGLVLALFGAGGVVTAIMRLRDARHVEPIGVALLALMLVGGLLLIWLGTQRARAMAERGPELAVLSVAHRHAGRVTPVLVASETELGIDGAERELAALAERGACVRRTADDGAPYFLFPELENEGVKRKLFFTDAQARRPRAEKVRR
jgi:hypothetical protein